MSEAALENEETESDDTMEGIKSPLDMTDAETEALDIEAYIGNLSTDEEKELEETTSEAEEEISTDEGDEEEETSVDADPYTDGDTEVTDSGSEEEESDETGLAVVDYKSGYEKILAPFKANGKDIQVGSIDEALTLMQMGANYNKKMAALKPNMKLLKMLEKNKLLDEDKLNYLIDLDKKNPGAVSKLLKDSELDAYELSNKEEETEYTPGNYGVSDKEVELDRVLEEIESSPSYDTTMDIVGNQWDNESRQILVDSPEIIKVINDHVALGVYDQITKTVEKERMLGKLGGLSDIAAYKTIGDAIQAQGGFAQHQKPPKAEQRVSSGDELSNRRKEQKLKSKRKAASPTKSSPSGSKSLNDYSPLEMSDEEFEKVSNKY